MKTIHSFFAIMILLFFAFTEIKAQTAEETYTLAEKLLYKDNNYEQAAAIAQKGLIDNPDHIGLHNIYATALVKNEKTRTTGIEQFELIMAMYPKETSIKERYASFIEKENPATALQVYDDVLRLNASSSKALYFTGQYYADKGSLLLSQNGEPKEIVNLMSIAADRFEQYLKLKPNDNNVKYTLVEVYKGLRLSDKAAAIEAQLPK